MRTLVSSLVLASAIVAASPAMAQQLSSVKIIRVQSTAGDESYLSNSTPTPTTTNIDHNGLSARVTIREIGIGVNRIVRMAGDLISPTNQVSSTNLCGTTTNPTSCRAGQTIIGADIIYSIEGYPNGLFDYRVRSSSGNQTYIVRTINVK